MSDITLTAIAYSDASTSTEAVRKTFDHIELAERWAYAQLAGGLIDAVEIETETGGMVGYLTAEVLAA